MKTEDVVPGNASTSGGFRGSVERIGDDNDTDGIALDIRKSENPFLVSGGAPTKQESESSEEEYSE